MQQMLKEMKERERRMASHGGENPYEVEYKKEQADKIADAESVDNMGPDTATVDKGSGMFGSGSKSYSF